MAKTSDNYERKLVITMKETSDNIPIANKCSSVYFIFKDKTLTKDVSFVDKIGPSWLYGELDP